MIIKILNPVYGGDNTLDLSPESEFRLTQVVQNLSGGSLNLTTSLPIPVKATQKNRLLLEDNAYTYIPCQVIVGETVIPVTGLYWSSSDDTDINIELLHAQRDWAKELSGKKLTDIGLLINGSISLTADNIEANWGTPIWQDGEVPFYLGLMRPNLLLAQSYTDIAEGVDYTLSTSGKVAVCPNDLRPLVSVLFLLQEMFTLIGWTFKSPFFESQYGRSLFAYLLAEKFAQDNGLNSNFRATYTGATYNAHNPALTTLPFTDVTTTGNYTGGDYNPTTSNYISPYLYPVKAHISTGLFLSHSFSTKKIVTVTIRIVNDANPAQEFFDKDSLDFVIEVGQTLECIVEWKNAVIFPLFRVEVRARITDGTDLDCHAGSWYKLEMANNSYYMGDLLHPLLRDDTCLDVLKGISHAINGFFTTNLAEKTVTLYPPRTLTLFGETIEGFYSLYTRDLPNTYGYKISRSKQTNRDLRIDWKGTQDINHTEKTYGKIVRLSETETQDTDNFNPYFNAVWDVRALKNKTDYYSPLIAGVDSSTDLTVLDIVEPFIVRAFGRVHQLVRKPDAFTVNIFANEYTTFSLVATQSIPIRDYITIPYVSQLPTAYDENGSLYTEGFSYGSYESDLSQNFYEPFLRGVIDVEFLTPDVQLSDVISEDIFRSRLAVQMNGRPQVIYPTKVNDYQRTLPSIIGGQLNILTDPPLCDGWVTTADFTFYENINVSGLTNPNYITVKMGHENLTPLEVYIGVYQPLSMTDFCAVIRDFLNLLMPCKYTGENFLTLSYPKCVWFEILIEVEILGDRFKWARIDPTGSYVSADLDVFWGGYTDKTNWILLSKPLNITNVRY